MAIRLALGKIPSTLAGTLACLLGTACFSSGGGASTYTDTTGAPKPPGAAIGGGCTDDSSCRTGLVCGADSKCALGHDVAVGASCFLNSDCVAGAYCQATATATGPSRSCTARTGGVAGSDGGATGTGVDGTVPPGQVGASCQGDGDCNDGLRCGLVGLGAACIPEGSGDIGAACTTSNDCLGGLACAAAECALGPPGAPPFGLPTWQGETCETESGPPAAWFHVPRGTDDKDFYRLPFPNDIRMKGGHPDLSGHPTPGSELLGFDVVDRYLRAIEADNDGFSTYPTVLFRFNSFIDITSWRKDSAVEWLDLTDMGTPRGLSWDAETSRTSYICPFWLAVRPNQGEPLTPGHTYAVLLTSVGTAQDGSAFAQGEDLPALLAAQAPADATLTAAYAAYKPLRDYMTSKSMAASTIVNAAVFTVGHVQRTAQKLPAAIAAAGVPAPSSWVKCGSGPSPCPDTTGDRACPATPDPAFDELHTLISLPIFQQGTAPYLDPTNGGKIDPSAASPPVQRVEQVCAALTVPKGAAMPATGWPLVVYAHGTGGSFRSHINEGVAKAMATATSKGSSVPFAVLGIDQVEHGPRRGASMQSPNNLFFNFANPAAARDNALQGAADQIALGHLAGTLDIAAASSPTGAEIKFDPAAITYWGHSQGSTEGGIAVPFASDFKGAVFSGQGASLIDALLSKTNPVNIAAAVPFALEDVDPQNPTVVRGGVSHPVLALLQMYIDPSDPLNYAENVAALPVMGANARHVFQVYGQKDTYSPPVTEATYAIAAHLGVAPHDASVTMPDALGPLTEAKSAVSGNLGDMVKVTAVVREYAPGAYDGHFVAFDNADALADVTGFLGAIGLGQTPSVGP